VTTHKPRRENSFREPRLPSDLTSTLIERIMALPESAKADYLKGHFLSKFVSSETDPASLRRSRALEKWLLTEERNAETEVRLAFTPLEQSLLPGVSYDRFVSKCQQMVVDIIGETPPIDALIGAFSGGASTSRGRTMSHPAFKYVGRAHATSRCLELLPLLEEECPLWFGDRAVSDIKFDIVPGNVFFTVPKKSDIDRVACKEPDLNMFIQKGIGAHFRASLRRIGINLNDQSINRSLARIGSISNDLATLDLSSASDSVTREIVWQFLPETWFTLLDSVRSHVTVIDGEEHRNCMFSSMGNGFTFELESLLFYVLVRAVSYFTGTRGVVSVYGDDIICPSSSVADVVTILEYFGFLVNTDKSFTDGPIRESCGGHYLHGYDITPFYLRKPISRVTELIDIANKLRQWAGEGSEAHPLQLLSLEVEQIWIWLKSFVPRSLWGGGDLQFMYQLASYDDPHSRLVEETEKKGTGPGGYLMWHNAMMGRTNPSDGVETSSYNRSLGKLRIRRVRSTVKPRLPQLFLHEMVGVPVE